MCDVCCEKFNRKNKVQVACLYCNFSACRICIHKYLLGSIHEPHCMACKKAWPMDFQLLNLTKSFLRGKYRQNRELIYFNEEKTHFPRLVPEVAARLQWRKRELAIKTLKDRLIENEFNEEQLVRCKKENHARLLAELSQLKQTELPRIKIKKATTIKCPVELCRGFTDVDSNCGLCGCAICNKCHTIKSDPHVCNPDDLCTIKELQASARPCPKCFVPIIKASGCDQMFCTQCHTAFSWDTGAIERDIIHNPHYFEMMAAGEIVNNDTIDTRRFAQIVNGHRGLIHHFQQIIHHDAVTMSRFNRQEHDDNDRVAFLSGEITQAIFMQRIFIKRQVKVRMTEEECQMRSLISIGANLINSIDETNIDSIFEQFTTLFISTKIAIANIDQSYQFKGVVQPDEIVVF